MNGRLQTLELVRNAAGESFLVNVDGARLRLEPPEAAAWRAMSSGVPDQAAADIVIRVYGLDSSAARAIVSSLREKLSSTFGLPSAE